MWIILKVALLAIGMTITALTANSADLGATAGAAPAISTARS